ncbi:hypothetical protein [Streptomyces acidiscabies]|uniref:hypothetical protein n=1 Tax=Streptomyces acidiscabies TaxID=42234 RepID=UPI000969A0DB|nr:hypothetical protein [Streptomyces acidiscabies]GAV38239.1 hypothetical protein Saa2_01118 [Streptomyces acidiscabies]
MHSPHAYDGAQLRSFATAIGSHITRLPDPDINDPVHTPDFAEMTRQAGELTDLAKELTGYLLHADSHIPSYGETAERWQLSGALSDLLTATGHVSQTATQLAHLTKIHSTPGQPDFEHELESTLAIAANALYDARFTLQQSAAELHRLANHRDHPHNPHALARTTTASRAPSGFERSPATTPPPLPGPRTARSL